MADVATVTQGIMSTIYLGTMWGISIAVPAIITIFLAWRATYKIKLRKVYMQNPSFEQDTIAKIITGKDKVPKLKVFMKKEAYPPPPEAAYKHTKRGKKSVTLHIYDDHKHSYVVPTFQHELKAFATVTAFRSQDKAWYIQQLRSAEARKQKSWQEILMQALPIIAFIIILAILVFGWGEIVTNTAKYQSQTHQQGITFFKEMTLRKAEMCGQVATSPAPPVEPPPE